MEEIYNRIVANWDLITSTALAAWAIAHWSYRARHESQQALIALLQRQADELRGKTNGAASGDSQAKTDELERRPDPLYPLTQPQQDRLASALTHTGPQARFPVLIMSPVNAVDQGERMAKVFEDSGWPVTFQATPFMPSQASGIHVLRPKGGQSANHASTARSIMKLLDDAGVVVGGAEQSLRPDQVVLLVARQPT